MPMTFHRAVKLGLDDLALFGGPPQFELPLHVGRPNIGDRSYLHRLLDDILDRGWLTNHGQVVQELERRLSTFFRVRHCIAVCNGTVALEIAVRALGLEGEVVVPSFTFVASAHALQWQQITPVFCDIDRDTHTLDPVRVEQMISSRTSGILGVHVWGRTCDVEALTEIARRRKVALLFDAAHAFGVSRRGVMVGGFGDCEILSFHATKVFNTFEGGAILTNDDDLATRVRWMQNFGFSGIDRVDHIGINGKMSEISAAMGLVSFEAFDSFVEVNRSRLRRYKERLSHLPGLRVVSFDETERQNYQYVVVEVGPSAGVTRDDLVAVLQAERVLARRYFYPGVHRMEPYKSLYPNAGLLLPVTESLVNQTLILPTGTAVTMDAVDGVCDIIAIAVGKASEMSSRLRRLQAL